MDEDEAAAIELELLCRAYEASVKDSSLTSDLASEDDPESAQDRVFEAAAAKQTRIPVPSPTDPDTSRNDTRQ